MMTFIHLLFNLSVSSLCTASMHTILVYHKSCNIHATPDIPVHHAQTNTIFLMVFT